MRSGLGGLVAGAGMSVLLCSPALADSWRVASGFDYSSGMYGDTRSTEVLAVPLTAKYLHRNWTFRVSTPFLSIDGPGNVTVVDDATGGPSGGDTGSGGDVIGAPNTPRQRRSGFGDTTLGATYSFRRLGGSRAYLDVTGKVRLPTGSQSRGLGVGATDVITDAELGAAWKRGGAYIDLGRRFLGDSEAFQRVDGWQASTGVWVTAGKDELGAYYSWRNSAFRGADNPQEIGAYISRRINRNLKFQVLASAGLNNSSPDFSTGMTITYYGYPGRR